MAYVSGGPQKAYKKKNLKIVVAGFFLQAGYSSCHPTNNVKTLKGDLTCNDWGKIGLPNKYVLKAVSVLCSQSIVYWHYSLFLKVQFHT